VNDALEGRRTAVVGYGNQGEAQALNLRDAGAPPRIGARPGGASAARAHAAGFEVVTPTEAVRGADVIAVLVPDESVPGLWPALLAAAAGPRAFVFAHGFALLYGDLPMPAAHDVVLVAPTAPGRVLRATAAAGRRLPAYVAAHHDASGRALATAEAWADAIGCGPLWRTTAREETEVDLFGEQVVLCGGLNALVREAFEVLTARGYAPEIAYLECVHQLRYLAELLHERGPAGFRRAISGTALYGDLTRGPRVIGAVARAEMERILEEIRSGAFAREWRAEAESGRRRLEEEVRRAARHPIETARRRAIGAPDESGSGR
jgi:ketol-acid reductoisomerase